MLEIVTNKKKTRTYVYIYNIYKQTDTRLSQYSSTRNMQDQDQTSAS